MKTKFLYRCPKCSYLMKFDTEEKRVICREGEVTPQRLYMKRFYWVKTGVYNFWQPAYLNTSGNFDILFGSDAVKYVGKQIKEPKES